MNAYWFSLPALYILLSGVPRALTGGFITMIMACYAYISDITKIRSRTMRIAILDHRVHKRVSAYVIVCVCPGLFVCIFMCFFCLCVLLFMY